MTRSSGKPPVDAPPNDSSWGSPDEVEPEADSFSAAAEEDGDEPVYGVGVPYGGNDRTEEIDPIALDMPFSPDDVMTPPIVTPALVTPRRPATSQAPAVHRDSELKAPVAQLVLSDLFDSTPPPPGSSLEPPDPAAFSTSRPPAKPSFFSKHRERVEPAPEPSGSVWGVSRPNADLKYFGGNPAGAAASNAAASNAAASNAAASNPPRPAARASTPAAAPRPYPAGAPTRSSGFPGASESRVQVSTRGSEPITSGGVVALPSINVLAEPLFPRPDTVRPRVSEPPPSASQLDPITPEPPTPEPPTPRPSTPEPAQAVSQQAVSTAEPEPSTDPEFAAQPSDEMRLGSAAAHGEAASSAAASSAAASSEAASSAVISSDAEPSAEVPSDVVIVPASDLLAGMSAPVSAQAVSSEALSSAAVSSSEGVPSSVLPIDPAPSMDAPSPSSAEPRQRRSVPTLESVGNAAARQPRTAARRSRARSAPPDEVARFPSDVPTSRPPDVVLAAQPPEPGAVPGGRARARSSAPPGARRPSAPPQSVLAMPPSTKTGQIALPSVMLGQDVEAEPDSASVRRAQRAARATVRIELPENWGRPGSALLPISAVPGTSTALPLPEREVKFRGFAVKRNTVWVVLAGVLFVVVCLLMLRPRSGTLVVTALGTGHRAVESVQIFVDGKALCDSSPCRITGLTPGPHVLRASAPGLASAAEQSVEINAGEEAATNIDLVGTEPEVQAGGLRVAAGEHDLTLFVDDRRVGKLPQTVSGLAGGKHWLKLVPEDGSETIEKSVSVQPGEMIDVDARPAKRDKVVVTIKLNADSEGASVTFDEAFLLDFPAELELDPKSSHTLTASKPGYEDYTLRLDLGDEPEKQVEVALTPAEGAIAHRPRPKPAAAASAPTGASASQAPAHKASSKPAPLDATQGLLNISSVPPSQIILNGRPLGSTPKTAVVVPGDSLQTIVFVHPKMGRRRAQKFVPGGKERTVSIRF